MLDGVFIVIVSALVERSFALTIFRYFGARADHDRFYAAYGIVSAPRSLLSVATGIPMIATAWLGFDRDLSVVLSLICMVAVVASAVYDGLRAIKAAAI